MNNISSIEIGKVSLKLPDEIQYPSINNFHFLK
jgi:hypothetical protein